MVETLPPKNFTFDGLVKINFWAKEATNLIRMHANDMTIDEGSIMLTNKDTGEEVPVSGTVMAEPGDDRHFFDINLPSELTAGSNYTVSINFVGKLNDDMEGFYRSNYFEDGEEK
jgi:hypothetical protein